MGRALRWCLAGLMIVAAGFTCFSARELIGTGLEQALPHQARHSALAPHCTVLAIDRHSNITIAGPCPDQPPSPDVTLTAWLGERLGL